MPGKKDGAVCLTARIDAETARPARVVLRREGAERGVLGIDLEREAAIPEDDEVAGLVDLIDDAAIASTQS